MAKSNALLGAFTAVPVIDGSLPQSPRSLICGSFIHSNKNALATICRLSSQHHDNWRSVVAEPEPGQAAFNWVISTLSPVTTQPLPPLRTDLDSFSYIVSQVVEATQENIITDEEAEALTGVLSAAFVQRRVGRVMQRLFSQDKPKVFMAAAGREHERQIH
jgi:hypothetical protein